MKGKAYDIYQRLSLLFLRAENLPNVPFLYARSLGVFYWAVKAPDKTEKRLCLNLIFPAF